MRTLACLVVLVVLALVGVGCGGEVAESGGTVASEAPDAVAVAEETEEPDVVEETASAEAEVQIEDAGFSVGENDEVGYGLVLRNVSDTSDATDVEITVNLLDKSGMVLETDAQELNLIPAGERFYFGGSIYQSASGKPAKLEAFVDVGESLPAIYRLPEATHVRITNQEYFGIIVQGQVHNDFEGTLLSHATIGCVLFSKTGKVVGGGFGYLDADLPSGRTAAFKILNGPSCTPRSKAAKARVSVDNSFE